MSNTAENNELLKAASKRLEKNNRKLRKKLSEAEKNHVIRLDLKNMVFRIN
jgi:hypothetical protein